MTRSSTKTSPGPLPPGVERRRRLRQERKRERLIQLWRFSLLGSSAMALGWVLLSQGWTLRRDDQVRVQGSERLGVEAVIEAAQLRFPQPLLSLQPQAIEAQLLKKLPIQGVAVQRRLLPPGLSVQLEDRRPLARATRKGAQGIEQGMVDRRGHWMARTPDEHGERPESDIQVLGWTQAQRPTLSRLLERRDQLGSPLQTIAFQANGSLSLRTQALGLVHFGNDPRLLDQQLVTLIQLSRSLPDHLRNQPGSSLDLRDPSKPELQLPAPAKPPDQKTSER